MMRDKCNVGWAGVFKSYPKTNLCKSAIKSVIATILILFVVLLFSEVYATIENTLQFIVTTLPTILGFTLAALALFFSVAINFSGLFHRSESDEPSLFQVVQSTFAVIVLVMVLTLGFSYIISIIINNSVDVPRQLAFITNTTTLFLMIFLLFYTLFSILDVIINLFNLGQYIQSLFDKEQKKAESQSNNKGA